MHASNFDEVLDQILLKDARYCRDAYLFVREALDHTQKAAPKSARETEKQEARHVSGQELLEGIRRYALDQFGPMTLSVLHEWGIRCCEDFGEIVFNMVETHLLAKTKNDSREDFKNGYDFEEAFRKPFEPSGGKSASGRAPDMKPKAA
jgi:uncharacterized repeat protein (TIGR04138 family)